MRSKSCLCKNLVTTSAPNVKDTPLSFSPQPIVSLNVINAIIKQIKKKLLIQIDKLLLLLYQDLTIVNHIKVLDQAHL